MEECASFHLEEYSKYDKSKTIETDLLKSFSIDTNGLYIDDIKDTISFQKLTLNIDSYDAKKINNKLSSYYNDTISFKEDGIHWYYYDVIESSKYLNIRIMESSTVPNAGSLENVFVEDYNINKETGKIVSNEELKREYSATVSDDNIIDYYVKDSGCTDDECDGLKDIVSTVLYYISNDEKLNTIVVVSTNGSEYTNYVIDNNKIIK